MLALCLADCASIHTTLSGERVSTKYTILTTQNEMRFDYDYDVNQGLSVARVRKKERGKKLTPLFKLLMPAKIALCIRVMFHH